ncbi:MAG: type II secretion system protein [Phycisphaerales bacterium]
MPRPDRSDPRAFTLIELLVVVSVIALLIGILLPTLGSARDRAQAVRCQANLRSLAQAAVTHTGDHRGAYSTGPSDNRRDRGYGPIDEKGWMADFIIGEYANPGNLLCPTHPAKDNQNLDLDRLNDNPWKPFDENGQRRLLTAGYNSNYAQSWHMGLTGLKDHFDTSINDPKDPENCVGPLSVRYTDRVSASRVVLFGDARTKVDDFGTFQGERRRVVKAMGDGPEVGADGAWGLQNMTDFGAAHGRDWPQSTDAKSDRSVGHLAFADGHVEGFKDEVDPRTGSRDGFFDSYFDRDSSPPRLRYRELDRKVFGGWLNQPSKFD